jgi:hypothetical protein
MGARSSTVSENENTTPMLSGRSIHESEMSDLACTKKELIKDTIDQIKLRKKAKSKSRKDRKMDG